MELILILLLLIAGLTTVDNSYDIRKYYNKPYCEEVKVGAEKIKKCYKVVEVKE